MKSSAPPPKRLAPQRKRHTTAANAPTPIASSSTTPPPPLDLSIDIPDENEHISHDGGAAAVITQAVADWTLRDKPSPIHASDDDDDDEEEEEEYHGEIDSDDDDDEDEDVDNSQQQPHVEIPPGYAPISPDELSASSPPTHPLLLVDLKLLYACHPDRDEKKLLLSQWNDALSGKGGDDTGLNSDERIIEWLESGVATHIDSSTEVAHRWEDVVDNDHRHDASQRQEEEEEGTSLAVLPYPEFLTVNPTQEVRSTLRLWKVLHASHPLPVMQRLLVHLRNTSRSLRWKVEMHNQLRVLAMEEHAEGVRRSENREYEEWKGGRKEKLEKLYEVRDTFLLRVDLARDRYEKLVQERERRVAIEMRRRRGDAWQQSKPVVRETLDDGNIDVFDQYNNYDDDDDDGWGGAIPEEDIIGHDAGNMLNIAYGQDSQVVDDDDDNDSNEEWSPVGMSVVVKQSSNPAATGPELETNRQVNDTNNTIRKLQPITMDDNAQRKSKRLEKAKDQSTSQNAIAKEEEMVREKLKTNDERIAEAMLRNLQERLDGVDNLLENLQEEEWADEENDEEQDDSNDKIVEETPDASEMTLLDQILAMILGALSMTFSGATCKEEHFRYIKEEHKSIVKEWKETFGRLPPSFRAEDDTVSIAHSNKLGDADALSKEKLSAMCNDSKDWDEVDWDALMP
ncbi:hypothetical protein HJC23_004797 [Cyclotella cryptica]|uniref:Uncharacterized protein n=1 Tax=Cyclotella cryptica TaxID=29204 RepID=A0ABD3PYE6_9STRA|eukprot:CCRYP_010420-RA/>CCRYP_010420-RA protein AED:0.13 eAED:0.13 QI:0/1/0.5/1/1/1/2/35/681